MKGGLAVMIAALEAFERHPGAHMAGYEVVINSDEEVGSASSAALIAAAARGKLAALTYEPSALPDGTLAGARPGSGNFSFHVAGRSAHAGRNPEEGRNAVAAAAELALALEALRRDGLSVHTHGGFGRPPKVLDDRALRLFSIVEEAGRALGQTIGRKDSGGVCDGNNIAACGVPVVDTMGVRGGAIHSEDEYLIPESLGERAALSALVIARLAGGAL
jgi:glutamate carboxypeptidase